MIKFEQYRNKGGGGFDINRNILTYEQLKELCDLLCQNKLVTPEEAEKTLRFIDSEWKRLHKSVDKQDKVWYTVHS